MGEITNLKTRPATADEVAAFEKENGLGYRYVRIFHGRCPNCGVELVQPRGLEDFHGALVGSGDYYCDATLPKQWPMTIGGAG